MAKHRRTSFRGTEAEHRETARWQLKHARAALRAGRCMDAFAAANRAVQDAAYLPGPRGRGTLKYEAAVVADKAARCVERRGARGLGGLRGTQDEHIAEAARLVRLGRDWLRDAEKDAATEAGHMYTCGAAKNVHLIAGAAGQEDKYDPGNRSGSAAHRLGDDAFRAMLRYCRRGG